MSAPVPSRENILERIRAATGATDPGLRAEAYASLPREYVRRGTLSAAARVELMIERLRDYDAEVVECRPEELVATITAQLKASGRKIFVAPSETPTAWCVQAAYEIEGFECTMDHWESGHGLRISEIEQAEGVMTASFCGVADSGTIVLHHSATEGRRVLTLLPDWHLCVLKASDVVETLPEYFARCAIRDQGSGIRGQDTGALPRLVTWISGPSATADIEMTRIKGVHGPQFLHVVLVRDE